MAVITTIPAPFTHALVSHGLRFEKLNSREIIQALKNRYKNKREWVFLEELTFPTGTRADACVFNAFYSKGFKRIAFEIKISRSDFLHELKNPDKRKSAVELFHEFYFVTPTGLLDKKDVPLDCGLMEVSKDGGTRIKVRAPKRAESPKNTSGFLSLLLRNATGWKVDKDFHLCCTFHEMQRNLLGFPKNLFA